MEGILKELYYHNLASKLSNAQTLYREAKKVETGVTLDEVKQFLAKQHVYQTFIEKPKRRLVKRWQAERHIDVSGPDKMWALDTFFLSKTGSTFPNALVAIDMFSRKAHLQFMGGVSSKSASTAFDKMLKEHGTPIKKVFSDFGSEFRGVFSQFVKKLGIEQVFTNRQAQHKTSMAERLIKDLRLKIAKLKTTGMKPNEAIKAAVVLHNNQYNRSIGMTPNQASDPKKAGDVELFIARQRAKEMDKIGKPVKQKFRIGQWVKIRKLKDLFRKTGEPTVISEAYKISGVKFTEPVISYYLQTSEQVALPGSFIQTQLIPAAGDNDRPNE